MKSCGGPDSGKNPVITNEFYRLKSSNMMPITRQAGIDSIICTHAVFVRYPEATSAAGTNALKAHSSKTAAPNDQRPHLK